MLTDPASPLREVAHVAHRLSVSPRFVWGLIRSGKLPAIRVGARLRVEEGDLQAYIDAQRVAATTDPPTDRPRLQPVPHSKGA